MSDCPKTFKTKSDYSICKFWKGWKLSEMFSIIEGVGSQDLKSKPLVF